MRKLRNGVGESNARILETPYSMETIDAAVGKPVRLISINDSGFAKKLLELLETGNGEE